MFYFASVYCCPRVFVVFPFVAREPIGGRFFLCLPSVAVGTETPYATVLRLQHGDHPTGQALIFN